MQDQVCVWQLGTVSSEKVYTRASNLGVAGVCGESESFTLGKHIWKQTHFSSLRDSCHLSVNQKLRLPQAPQLLRRARQE
ncbi:hypothetical protein P7K49_032492, partial [Saguinus oedipus]